MSTMTISPGKPIYGPTILTKVLTPVDKHRLGNHKDCGPSCFFTGLDLREAPIYQRLMVEYYAHIWTASMTRAGLAELAKVAGLKPGHKNKTQLRDMILDHLGAPKVDAAFAEMIVD